MTGLWNWNPDFEQRQPYSSLLPVDFPKRLERLKEASGLTWSGLAGAIGVDYKQMYRWRRGVEPSGGVLHALYMFAQPGYPAAWRSSWATGSS